MKGDAVLRRAGLGKQRCTLCPGLDPMAAGLPAKTHARGHQRRGEAEAGKDGVVRSTGKKEAAGVTRTALEGD